MTITWIERPNVLNALIDHAGAGDNEIIAAVAGKRIKFLSAKVVATAAVNVEFWAGAAGTQLVGDMNFGAAGQGFVDGGEEGILLPVATALVMNLSGAVAVDGNVRYYLV